MSKLSLLGHASVSIIFQKFDKTKNNLIYVKIVPILP